LIVTVASLGLASFGERAARRVQRRLHDLASHDQLTSLPNRINLDLAVESLLAKGSASRTAVLLIELDHFDSVNETSGHEIGDQLMIEAADRLRETLLPNESLFRLGGPQFIVLAPDAITLEVAEARAAAFQQSVRVQYRVDHDHQKISASAAVVMLDHRHEDAGVVIDDAVAAIRHAESLGPGRRAVFELSMRAMITPDEVERRLRAAFEQDEFLLMYLPVINIRDSRLVGLEALLRWADPERGVLPAGEFLHLIDKAGILHQVGDWTITEACRHNRSWQERFPDKDVVSTVNVAPAQLADSTFPDRLRRILDETSVDPGRMCVELTGVPRFDELDLIWSNLRTVKSFGLQIALDDFGVGFATFDFVRRFPLDVLKLDRSLVKRVTDSEGDAAIVQQLVMMVRELGLVTIAEGVDRAEQAAVLSSFGCELAQGFYWSQPVAVDAAEKLIVRGTIRPSASRARKIDWKAPGSSAARPAS